METKPSYEELEQRVKELENKVAKVIHAEEILRKREERYRTLIENAGEAI